MVCSGMRYLYGHSNSKLVRTDKVLASSMCTAGGRAIAIIHYSKGETCVRDPPW